MGGGDEGERTSNLILCLLSNQHKHIFKIGNPSSRGQISFSIKNIKEL